MEDRKAIQIRRERKRKIRRWRRLLLTVFVLASVGLGVYLAVTEFSVEKIEVTGNVTYSEDEIIKAMKEEDYIPNTLVMILQNKCFGHTYLPFIDRVKMGMKKNHTLTVHVDEKLRAGVFQYMKKYFYFNEEGVAMESRNTLFDSVPLVTGVKFREVKPNETIKVEGDYFDTIVMLTKKIIAYKLDISEIHFDGEDDITLVSGNYRIYLGTVACLDGKMSKIRKEIEAVSEVADEGIIDMHLFTDERQFVTFRKTDKSSREKKKKKK